MHPVLIVALALGLPCLGAWAIARRVSRSPVVPVVAPAVIGGLVLAFFFSAASAMATAVSPTAAVARGFGIGAGLGAAVGLVASGVARALRSKTPAA